MDLGTLGILTKLKFELIPAKPFVKMEYVSYPDFSSFNEAMLKHCREQDVEMMDAIIHSPTKTCSASRLWSIKPPM